MRCKCSLVCKNARGGGGDYAPATGHNLSREPKHQAGLATAAHKRDNSLRLQRSAVRKFIVESYLATFD